MANGFYGDTYSAVQAAQSADEARRQSREMQIAQAMLSGSANVGSRAMQVLGMAQAQKNADARQGLDQSYLQLQRDALANQATPQANSPTIVKFAENDALNGNYDPGAYTGLHPQLDQGLRRINDEAIAKRTQEYALSKAHADVLNKRVELTRKIEGWNKIITNTEGFWNTISGGGDELAKARENLEQLEAEKKALPHGDEKDPTYQEIHRLVVQHPKTGLWATTLTPPAAPKRRELPPTTVVPPAPEARMAIDVPAAWPNELPPPNVRQMQVLPARDFSAGEMPLQQQPPRSTVVQAAPRNVLSQQSPKGAVAGGKIAIRQGTNIWHIKPEDFELVVRRAQATNAPLPVIIQ